MQTSSTTRLCLIVLLTVGTFMVALASLAQASPVLALGAARLADAPGQPPQGGPGGGCAAAVRSDQMVEWEGAIVALPTDGFIGTWIIAPSSGEQKTVIVDCATELRDFGDQLPPIGAWVKARGTVDNNGDLHATRLRPDDRKSNQVVVALHPNVDVKSFAEHYGLKVELQMPLSPHIYLFSTTNDEDHDRDVIQADAKDVEWVEFNFISEIPTGNPFRSWHWGGQENTGYINQSAFGMVNLEPAAQAYLGDHVEVAILDTGVDLNHPELAPALDVLQSSDMVAHDDSPNDVGPGPGWGHGTHVAGIIHRIAPHSRLLPVRVLDSNGRGDSFILAYAIEWAALHGADVINLSLGADCGSRLLGEAVTAATAKRVVIVAAAGNDNVETAQCPASWPAVIGVTALADSGAKADFANYGDWVDMAAPGVGITSTVPTATGFQYAAWSGTSMATPFVSGAAALVREKFTTATADEIASRLANTGAFIDQDNAATYVGKLGRLVDIGAAVDAAPVPAAPDSLYIPLIRTH